MGRSLSRSSRSAWVAVVWSGVSGNGNEASNSRCHSVSGGYGCVERRMRVACVSSSSFARSSTATATFFLRFDHSGLPATQLCWDCHEIDRKDPTHYADELEPLLSWDCQGCHTATAWDWQPIEHPTRVPHGARVGQDEVTLQVDCAPAPDTQWQVGCEGCHPGGDTSSFVCFSCHAEAHGGPGGTWAESQCLGCHINGEPTTCAP